MTFLGLRPGGLPLVNELRLLGPARTPPLDAAAVAEIAGIGLLMPIVAVFTKPELMTQNAILRFYARIIGGGSETFLSKNKGKSLDAKLSRATKWVAIVFVVLTLILNIFK